MIAVSAVISTVVSFVMWFILGYLNYRRDVRKDRAKERLEVVLTPVKNLVEKIKRKLAVSGQLVFHSASFEADLKTLRRSVQESVPMRVIEEKRGELFQSINEVFTRISEIREPERDLSQLLYKDLRQSVGRIIKETKGVETVTDSGRRSGDPWELSGILYTGIVLDWSVDETNEKNSERIFDLISSASAVEIEKKFCTNFVSFTYKRVKQSESYVKFKQAQKEILKSIEAVEKLLSHQFTKDVDLAYPGKVP